MAQTQTLGINTYNGVPMLQVEYRGKSIYLWESQSMIEWHASR
jgi:hypothetical protein